MKKLMRQLKISGSISTGPLNTGLHTSTNKNVDTTSKIESFQRDLKIFINFWTSKSSREKEKLLQRNVLWFWNVFKITKLKGTMRFQLISINNFSS